MINKRVFDVSVELADNAMLKFRPDLFNEWDFEKNDELGLEVYLITKGSRKCVWWKCSKCDSKNFESIHKKMYGSKCSYCSGRKVNHTNSLATLNPELASEWHPTKNGDLTPHDVTAGKNTKVWWRCNQHSGHEWKAIINNRNQGIGCPYCNNKIILKGCNDMWTTNPELAKLLANPEDGYKYTQSSGQKVDWKCPDCGGVTKGKVIASINDRGVFCTNCSDGLSYPEKIMYYLLKQFDFEYKYDTSFSWSRDRRYDFYLINHKIIIETHGRQHYEECKRGKSLAEEQENDDNKHKLAMENGIGQYIVIDCRFSDFEYIKNNLIKSEIANILNLKDVDWESINMNTQKSLNIEILRLWNEDNLSLPEISEITKINNRTISKILRNFEKLNLCVYDGHRGRRRTMKEKTNTIYQFTKDMIFLKVWLGGKVINKELGLRASDIYNCCNGERKVSHGFIWKYEKDLIGWSVSINK